MGVTVRPCPFSFSNFYPNSFYTNSYPWTLLPGLVMIGLDVNDSFVFAAKQSLERAMVSDSKMESKLRKMIREVIKAARKDMVADVVGAARMKSDPRGAAYAIRTSVYRRILGANINIYSGRKAGKPTAYRPPRHPSHRGGNRWPVSEATQRINSYGPHDRGFILRFLNSGTMERTTRYGNRGSIEARAWFEPTAEPAMQEAVSQLSKMIDTELEKDNK